MLSPPTFTVTSGSSPRMRGKPSTRGLQGTRRRIIPAHAGQTTSGLPGSVTSSDHPRACGANVEMHASLGSHVGSSPRMRGKLICRFCRRCRMRIIPAHAGQTTRTTSCPARYPDHPRACGANLGKIGSLFGSFGSSPRMRGKRRPRPCPRTPVRIIPAHAGQTNSVPAKRSSHADHPRACGANGQQFLTNLGTFGSSPRMRGKPRLERDDSRTRRIIPAHAGQTSRTPTPTPTVSDHPRACGANAAAGRIRTLRRGSSPRMRGKQGGRRKLEREIRIIPAHAGQTTGTTRFREGFPDHPRACGANHVPQQDARQPRGSSPRMRGKLVIIFPRR